MFGKKQQPSSQIVYSANCDHRTCPECGGCHTNGCESYSAYCEQSVGGAAGRAMMATRERAQKIEQRGKKRS